jgi:pyruvate kinase
MLEKVSYNKTKIVATVGPASNTKEMLRALIVEGVDVFRLNFSHGKHEDHLKVVQAVRELNKELGSTVSLLQDLQGPKIRIDQMEPDVVIEAGQELIITSKDLVGNAKIASTSYKNLPTDVKPGDIILVDDGKIELKVKSIQGTEVTTEVVYGEIKKRYQLTVYKSIRSFLNRERS